MIFIMVHSTPRYSAHRDQLHFNQPTPIRVVLQKDIVVNKSCQQGSTHDDIDRTLGKLLAKTTLIEFRDKCALQFIAFVEKC